MTENAKPPKEQKSKRGRKSQPLKCIVKAPLGENGENIPILECYEDKVVYLIPDDVRIAYAQGLLDHAAELLSKA